MNHFLSDVSFLWEKNIPTYALNCKLQPNSFYFQNIRLDTNFSFSDDDTYMCLNVRRKKSKLHTRIIRSFESFQTHAEIPLMSFRFYSASLCWYGNSVFSYKNSLYIGFIKCTLVYSLSADRIYSCLFWKSMKQLLKLGRKVAST